MEEDMLEQDFSEIGKLSERYNKDPKSGIFVQLADAYRKNKMIDEALDILNKGLEHHPQYPLAYLIIGKCYFDKRMYEQAKEYFEKTLSFDPESVIALRMLAQTCVAMKDEKGQIFAYKGILALDPFDESAKKKLTYLESLQKKEQLYTAAMAEEYEKQGDIVNALSIYEQLLFTDPTDLLLQQKVKELKGKCSKKKEEIKEEKIEGLQVDNYYRPEDTKPKPEPTPIASQTTETISEPTPTPPPEEKTLEPVQREEEILALEDFLAETTTEEPTIEPPKPETPQPVEIPEHPQALEPEVKEEPITEPIEKPETPQPIDTPEEPVDEVTEKLDILQPFESEEPITEPVEKPETPQPVEIPEHPQALEPEIKEEPITEPIEKPTLSPVEPDKPDEPSKPKEEDFQSFKDWLSGLLK